MNSISNSIIFIIGICICLYSLTISSDSRIGFKFYNPDLIVLQQLTLLAIGIPILFMGTGYVVLETYKFSVNNWLKWISVALFTCSFLTLLFIFIFYTYVPPSTERYYRFDSFESYNLEESIQNRINLIKTLLFSCLFIFYLSILISVFNWIKVIIISQKLDALHEIQRDQDILDETFLK